MSTLDDLKEKWCQSRTAFTAPRPSAYTLESLHSLVRKRVKKQNNMIFRYFWSAFTLHNIVYALLGFVILKYGSDPIIFILSVAGLITLIPFTVFMMKRYKALAVGKLSRDSNTSIYEYVSRQRNLLLDFFLFKKRYDMFLLPICSAIGVILTFELFFPGGIQEFIQEAFVVFALTMLSCVLVIATENQKSFIQPLNELQAILDEYSE